LKNAIYRRSQNKKRLAVLVEEMGRLDLGSKKNLMNFVKTKIVEGVFPRSFLN
jgi:hypothetical protein